MFEALSPIQKDHIFKVMQSRDVVAGDVIIKEGEQGDDMYLVDRGQFIVYKKDENGVEQQIFGYNEEGAAFGELSLMYGKPRAASVVAKTDGKLWSLGRAAFRAVMMRGKAEGLLEIYQTVPILAEQSIPALHRLCLSSKELHFEKGAVVVSKDQPVTWEICIILTGVLKLVPKDSSHKRQLRAELAYFSVAEIGSAFESAIAESNLKISCISHEIWLETVGAQGDAGMKAELAKSKSKGIRLKPVVSPFTVEENIALPTIRMADYKLDHPVNFIADYGYIGSFEDLQTDQMVTIKVFSKSKVHAHRMEKSIVTDRQILAVMNKVAVDKVGFPTVLGSFVDDKWAYLVMKDNFVSDLGMVVSSQTVGEEVKVQWMAHLYSALVKVHSMGLIHRFVNCNSCYVTSSGTLKVSRGQSNGEKETACASHLSSHSMQRGWLTF